VVAALVEGCSIRATARMTGVAKNTIVKLLVDLGAACAKYQDEHLRNLKCRRIECDEIWSFLYAKQKNVANAKRAPEAAGDVWTWTALDADSKLVPTWRIGTRDLGTAYDFMHDLAERLSNRVQLTTDGHRPYLEAVESAFGEDIDFAQLVKIYGSDPEAEKRYSPAKCLGCNVRTVTGEPNPKHISTSYVERQNLTMRMSMKRFARLSNGFSRKLENHTATVALYFMFYNFARIHQTLRTSPAQAAGVTEKLWDIEGIVGLLEKGQ
jgi:IS1 family transposase